MNKNFIIEIINRDIKENAFDKKVRTRFPPEPNGYLHIGHAKSICLNFGIAELYKGTCNLRFDDTNPLKENINYINSIIEDIEWLGFNCKNNVLYASDYFNQMYKYAVKLIKSGLAYVDDQTIDEIKKNRGDYNIKGVESPYRNRKIEENLILFSNMKKGMYVDGEKVLRAKIDMCSKNINLRDPIMYRILHVPHHRTKTEWCIYPMYDWAHGLEDSIEKITHSICTLEFEDHRSLYNWFLKKLKIFHPKQIEFAKLNMSYTVISKRNLLKLVENQHVEGWDDPRMPTLSGLRRRGYTSNAIKNFIFSLGVAKREAISDFDHLEHFVREDLNLNANRVMAVLNPIKLIIENYSENKTEYLKAENNPEDKKSGSRKIPFTKELFIERDDFMEKPIKKFFRLFVGNEVRLKHAYYVKCTGFTKHSNGNIKEIKCKYDPSTRGGWSNDKRKVRGTIHWVSSIHAINARVRLYDKLFNKKNPLDCDINANFMENFNKDSVQTIEHVKVEPSLKNAAANDKYQFLRKGYFICDKTSNENGLIFNKTVGLRDTWAKKNK